MSFKLSPRSIKMLTGVNQQLVEVVYRAITISKIDFAVIEGVRTQARQRELVDTQLAALRTVQLAVLDPEMIAAIESADVPSLTTEQLASLSPAQAAAMTSEQFAAMTTAQFAAFTTAQRWDTVVPRLQHFAEPSRFTF